MNRIDKMQAFLVRLANITKNDPQVMLQNTSRIYGELIRIGLSNEQRTFAVGDYFDHWINDFIKNGLYEPNPFLLTDGNIADATDANYSFNSELTSYLHECIYKCYQTDNLDNVNIRDFYLHVRDSYDEVFYEKDKEVIENYMSSRNIKIDFSRFSNSANKSKIVELLLKSMSPNGRLEHVAQTYDKLMDAEGVYV